MTAMRVFCRYCSNLQNCHVKSLPLLCFTHQDFTHHSRISHSTVLGVSAACRESFRVLTFRTSFMTQPPGRYTYCQSKARYSWIIFRKISPYNLLRRPVFRFHWHKKGRKKKRIAFSGLGESECSRLVEAELAREGNKMHATWERHFRRTQRKYSKL